MRREGIVLSNNESMKANQAHAHTRRAENAWSGMKTEQNEIKKKENKPWRQVWKCHICLGRVLPSLPAFALPLRGDAVKWKAVCCWGARVFVCLGECKNSISFFLFLFFVLFFFFFVSCCEDHSSRMHYWTAHFNRLCHLYDAKYQARLIYPDIWER